MKLPALAIALALAASPSLAQSARVVDGDTIHVDGGGRSHDSCEMRQRRAISHIAGALSARKLSVRLLHVPQVRLDTPRRMTGPRLSSHNTWTGLSTPKNG